MNVVVVVVVVVVVCVCVCVCVCVFVLHSVYALRSRHATTPYMMYWLCRHARRG